MKKILSVLLVLAAVFAVASCVSQPAPAEGPKPADTVLTPDVLEHKGTALGANVPAWTMAYIENGPSGVEKLPEYKGKYVIVLDSEGASKQGTIAAMDNMDAPVQIARYLSTRVQQKFAGAQVGDRDQLQEYFENVVKTVSEARFSGFMAGPDWWVYLQYYKPGAKAKTEVDRRIYRVIKIYTIDQDVLKNQLDKYLNDAEAAVAKTPEKQRAMDAVQSAFYEGF
ncbi:MAG: hypothetical protein KKA67_07830 [Spirochaetes bacterium]|nr:hypothetical protein [Spirochaetota bacterium]MBU1082081.1 hypothetical protein [Spirochaetota bacterium]